jgi:FkbM family methyltransferase
VIIRRLPLVRGLRMLRQLPQIIGSLDERVQAIENARTAVLAAVAEGEGRVIAGLDALRDQIRDTRQPTAVYLGDHRALTTTVWDTQMFVDTRDLGFTPHILANGVWELANTKAFLRQMRAGMTVVEVGANFGYFTLIGARLVGPSGKYYAFEPNDVTFDCLRSSVVINGFGGIVTTTNMAVSDRSGTAVLHKSAVYTTNSNIVAGTRDLLPGTEDVFTEEEIAVVSLDDFFPANGPQIEFLKIDAEGSEPAIFRGMTNILRRNPDIRIMFEFAPLWIQQSEDPSICLHFLQDFGLRFWIVAGTDGDLVPASIPELLLRPFCEVIAARALG